MLIAYHSDDPDIWRFGCECCDETMSIKEDNDRLAASWGKMPSVKCDHKRSWKG